MEDRSGSSVVGRKITPVYLLWNEELLIHAPAQRVWRHVLNYPSWQVYSIMQHVSGKQGTEGEVVLLKKDEAGFEFPPYYARTIKLDPGSRIIWKTYPEKTSDFFGIVDFKVHPLGDSTRFSYDILYEFLVPYENESEVEAFRKRQHDSSAAVFASIFPKLKRLSEQGA